MCAESQARNRPESHETKKKAKTKQKTNKNVEQQQKIVLHIFFLFFAVFSLVFGAGVGISVIVRSILITGGQREVLNSNCRGIEEGTRAQESNNSEQLDPDIDPESEKVTA